jgi:hypothetical protein
MMRPRYWRRVWTAASRAGSCDERGLLDEWILLSLRRARREALTAGVSQDEVDNITMDGIIAGRLDQMTKTIKLTDFLTDQQIGQAAAIYEHAPDQAAAKREIQEKIIDPNMGTINERLGQENDAGYLAYVVIYVCQEAMKQ